MLTAIYITVYYIFFTVLALKRYHIALALMFFLLPTYLIRFHIGPLPTTLLEGMILLLLTIGVWKYRHTIKYSILNSVKKHPSLFIASGLFLLGATISIFTSNNLRAALGEWKAFYIEPFLMFLLLIIVFNNRTLKQTTNGKRNIQYSILNIKSSNLSIFQSSPIHLILLALISGGLITSILAIYQHFTGWLVPWDFWENRNTYRVTGWYGYPNAVGLFLAPLMPIALYLIIYFYRLLKSKWKVESRKWSISMKIHNISYFLLPTFYLLLSPIAIFYAKGAGPLIGILGGAFFLMLLYKKTRWLAVAAGLIGIVALFSLPPSNSLRQEILMEDRSGRIRKEMWAETVQYLSEHPITGTGLASYSDKIAPYRIDTHIEIFHLPHNLFLSIWVNTGIIGVVGFVWIIVWFYRVGFFAPSRQHQLSVNQDYPDIRNFLITSMTMLLITGLVDTPYIKNDLSVFFWLLIALMTLSTLPVQEQIQGPPEKDHQG